MENPSSQFSLFVIHDNGAIEVLKLTDSPLAFRLKLGPSEVRTIFCIAGGGGGENFKWK